MSVISVGAVAILCSTRLPFCFITSHITWGISWSKPSHDCHHSCCVTGGCLYISGRCSFILFGTDLRTVPLKRVCLNISWLLFDISILSQEHKKRLLQIKLWYISICEEMNAAINTSHHLQVSRIAWKRWKLDEANSKQCCFYSSCEGMQSMEGAMHSII